MIQAKGRELFFARMEIAQEFEMLWPTKDGKLEKVASKGTVRWLKNARLTRIDSDRMIPDPGTVELHPEQWTTGFDGVHSYSWNRAAKLISYGTLRPGVIGYSPNLLFWGRTAIAYPQPMFGPNPKITRATRDGREEIDMVQEVPEAKLSIRYVGIVPTRSYLPTRVEQRTNDRLEALTEFQDFFQPHPGVWAPKTILWTAWSADNDANGKPIVTNRAKTTVTKLELGDNAKLQEEEFQLKLPDDVKEVDAATANIARDGRGAPIPAGSGDPRRAQADQPQPKGKEAQSLFKKWQENDRGNGNIPGGVLVPLVRVMTNFIKNNPTHEAAPKFAELLKRIDVSHDWTPAEAVKLLDEVSAAYANLPEWVEDEPRFTLGGAIQTGQPLPEELKNAPWGEAQPNGLRVAWLLEPRALKYRLGTPLKSRILFHNAGQETVVFRALTWNQSGSHKAHDANGDEIKIVSTEWTTLPRTIACRLAPGEFLEVTAAGIGVGANKDDEDWRGTRVGSWIEAKEGDEVTFIPAPVSALGLIAEEPLPNAPSPWWLRFISNRLSLDRPLPADAAERRRLLDRATRDLFGNAPTAEEITAFTTDAAPDALDALAKRLANRTGFVPFSGSLKSGTRKFLVLPVDPDAAKKPRTAKNPGQYKLGGNATLVVTRRPIGERIVNEAHLAFSPTDATKPAPREPHEIKLPDGYNTWAAAWERDATVLWVQQKGIVRRYDFTNPAQVKESPFAESEFDKLPNLILDALRDTLGMPDASK